MPEINAQAMQVQLQLIRSRAEAAQKLEVDDKPCRWRSFRFSEADFAAVARMFVEKQNTVPHLPAHVQGLHRRAVAPPEVDPVEEIRLGTCTVPGLSEKHPHGGQAWT
eukprot:508148-Karenia_brevis.AAC.1